MNGINRVFLLGNLGRDPELRRTASGKAFCRFPLATSRAFKRDDQWEELTDWHDVVIWDLSAERVHRRLAKGSTCLVEGRLAPRTWDDPDGRRRRMVEVVAERVVVLPTGTLRRNAAAPEEPAMDEREMARSEAVVPPECDDGELQAAM